MPKGMTGGALREPRSGDGILDRVLNNRFMDMVASLFPHLLVHLPILLWEDPLPAPLDSRIRVFAVEGVGH